MKIFKFFLCVESNFGEQNQEEVGTVETGWNNVLTILDHNVYCIVFYEKSKSVQQHCKQTNNEKLEIGKNNAPDVHRLRNT